MSISMINTHFTQFTFPRQINILHCSNFTLGCTAFRASWGGCTLINPHWSRSPRAGRSWLKPVWMTSSAGVAVFLRLLEVSAVAEDLLPFGGGQQVHRRVGCVNPWPSVYSSWCANLQPHCWCEWTGWKCTRMKWATSCLWSRSVAHSWLHPLEVHLEQKRWSSQRKAWCAPQGWEGGPSASLCTCWCHLFPCRQPEDHAPGPWYTLPWTNGTHIDGFGLPGKLL